MTEHRDPVREDRLRAALADIKVGTTTGMTQHRIERIVRDADYALDVLERGDTRNALMALRRGFQRAPAALRAASGSPTDAALREEPRCLSCGAPVVDALAGSCHQCGAEDRHIGSQWLAMPNDQRPSALRAASGSPEPVLDVERLARAMEDVFPGWLDEAPGTAEAQAEMRSYARQLGEAYEFLRGTASAALAPRPEPLDVERLAQTLPAVFNFRFSLAAKDDPVWLERAEAIAREYAALAPSEPTDG